jgi:hypothetical protein
MILELQHTLNSTCAKTKKKTHGRNKKMTKSFPTQQQ